MARRVCEHHVERFRDSWCARSTAAGNYESPDAEIWARWPKPPRLRIEGAAEVLEAESSASGEAAPPGGELPTCSAICSSMRRALTPRCAARSSRQASAMRSRTAGNPGAPIAIVRRKIGAAEERLQVRREPHGHGPAAAAGGGLHERHVDAVDIGALFAVHFDATRNRGSGAPRCPRSQTIRAPSRGTSGRWNSRWKGKWVCFPRAPFRKLPRPRDTSPPDYARAAAGRGFFRESAYW